MDLREKVKEDLLRSQRLNRSRKRDSFRYPNKLVVRLTNLYMDIYPGNSRNFFKNFAKCCIFLFLNRNVDITFTFPTGKITEEEVLKICGRIKRKRCADRSDLIRLSNGFLCSTVNILAFLRTQGAINVLVKELTDPCGNNQLLAAEAFCNMSLGGDSGSCTKIAKQIASYLVTIFTCGDNDLAQTSLWILYNLMAESERTQDVFLAIRVDMKLRSMLSGNYDTALLKVETTRCLSLVVSSSLFNRG